MYYGEYLLFSSRATSVRVISIKLINYVICHCSANIVCTCYPSYQCIGEVKRYPLMYYGEYLLFGSRATSVRVISIKLIN